MGTYIYPRIEGTDADWTQDMSGKAISRNLERLQKLVRKEGHKELMDYFVPSDEDLEEWGVDRKPGHEWFNPAEGLALIDSMIRESQGRSNDFENPGHLEEDLQAFRKILDRAAGEGRRWNLGMSY